MFRSSPIAVRRANPMLKDYYGPASAYRMNSTLQDLEFRSLYISFDKVDVVLLSSNII